MRITRQAQARSCAICERTLLMGERATRFSPAGDGSFTLAGVPSGRYRLHVWHERSPVEVVKEIAVGAGAAAVTDVPVTLNARGYRWAPHKNKYGRNYPTNEGRERY